MAVYIPPSASDKLALNTLLTTINKLQTAHPDGIFIVAGDFNQANLKTVLPKFHQHVTCPTRGQNTLDHVYSNIRDGYKASPLPHLGQSDHLSLFRTPAYRPLIVKTKPSVRNIKTWPEDAAAQLQDCFERTQWDLFANQDITDYTSTVMFYIRNCINNVTIDRDVRCYPNSKPWMTSAVRKLLRERNSAFGSGNDELYSTARSKLKRAIKEAKTAYGRRLEGHFNERDPWRVWQGIQQLTNSKGNRQLTTSSSSNLLAEELNHFFARFELSKAEPVPAAASSTDDLAFTVSTEDVRRVLHSVNPRKAAGPDGIPGRVLRDCADQLAEVFSDISLSTCTVPKCFKTATIVPVPKKTSITSLNDYRPVALTSTVIKCFERLVLAHIKYPLPPTLDQHQFAYRANRSTEDAINMALHSALTHLEHPGSYVRILFVDFSSAFNTIIPSRMVDKLFDLGVNANTCRWIKDFLTDRPQTVSMGSNHSPVLTLSTGPPQGCVLGPILYTIYTHDCTPTHSTNRIIKFADDTTVVGLINNNDESAYRDEVQKLTVWCTNNNLALNSTKTKELVIDFRRRREEPAPLYIKGDMVERVTDFKFLGTYISQDLTWTVNTITLVKKSQQRLYFLRTLRRANVSQQLLLSFYRCAVESILSYGILVWFASCTVAGRKALQRVIKTAQSIINTQLPSLEDIYKARCLRRATNITQDSFHPANHLFTLLPSGRRYGSLKARTCRLTNSFYPRAIRELNSNR